MVKHAWTTGSGWKSTAWTTSRTSVYLHKPKHIQLNKPSLTENSKLIQSFLFLMYLNAVWYCSLKMQKLWVLTSQFPAVSGCSAGFLTQVRAPTDGVCLRGLSGSPGSWTSTAAGERLRSCHSCRGRARTPPTYRWTNYFCRCCSFLVRLIKKRNVMDKISLTFHVLCLTAPGSRRVSSYGFQAIQWWR